MDESFMNKISAIDLFEQHSSDNYNIELHRNYILLIKKHNAIFFAALSRITSSFSSRQSRVMPVTVTYTCMLISGFQDSQDGQTYFLKLHAPWNTLISGAQLLNLRKRIKLRRVSQSSVTIALHSTPI